MRRISGMCAGAAGLLLASALPAMPADAPDPGAAGPGQPEVLVTARRRDEDVQQVPGAVSVIGGDLLDRSYTVNTQGLAQLVPSLTYSSANPRNTAITIRGLGSSVVAVSQANDGLEPGVGFYVDQVYHARPATAAFDFSDIDRIEVLRGPQGTLFGKNTTAGAISIASRAPTFTPEYSGEVSVGNYRFVQVKASASAAIVDDLLAFRLSGVSTRRDGVIRDVRGGDHNGVGNQAVKGQLLVTPSADLSLRLIADYTGFSSNCCTQVYLRVGRSLRPAARQFPALAAGIGYAPPSTNPYDRLTDIDAPLDVATSEGGVTGILDWNLGPATVTSVTGWRFWDWDAANDRDYTGVPIQLTQHIPSLQHQFSQEVRVASNGNGPFSYVGGLYYFWQRIRGRPISIYGPAATYWLLGPASQYPQTLLDGYGTDGRTVFNTHSYAAFGEVNWRPLDGLTLTGGLRYTHETKRGTYSTFVFGGLDTTGNTALTNAKLSILRPQSYAARDSDGSLSGRANIAYQVTGGILAYGSFARGYKSGGINMSGLALTATNQPALGTAVVRPERNTTWEVGLKSRLLDRRLVLNLAAYRTTVRDFQATIVDATQTVALRGYLSNIPAVVVKGVEADATALVLPDLTLRLSGTYAHGEYTDYPAGPCSLEYQGSATTACSLTGQRLSGLPRWAGTLGIDYAPALRGTDGTLVVHSDTSVRSGYYGDPSLSRYTFLRGYTVTNANLGFRSDKGWEVDLFARNLFARTYIQNLTIQAGNSGLILGTPGDPRTYGVTVRIWR